VLRRTADEDAPSRLGVVVDLVDLEGDGPRSERADRATCAVR
jgi:hypothetical protein